MQKLQIVITEKKFIYFLIGGGILAAIIKNNLHHAFDDYHVIILYFMIMPSFHDTRKGGGHIYLPEPHKNFFIRPKHFHQTPSLIGDYLYRFGFDSNAH